MSFSDFPRNGDVIELCLDEGVYAVLPPEDSEYKESYVALRKGAIVFALDKRISDPRAKVSLDVKQKDGSLLHVVDYASSGSTFYAESECAAWLER